MMISKINRVMKLWADAHSFYMCGIIFEEVIKFLKIQDFILVNFKAESGDEWGTDPYTDYLVFPISLFDRTDEDVKEWFFHCSVDSIGECGKQSRSNASFCEEKIKKMEKKIHNLTDKAWIEKKISNLQIKIAEYRKAIDHDKEIIKKIDSLKETDENYAIMKKIENNAEGFFLIHEMNEEGDV